MKDNSHINNSVGSAILERVHPSIGQSFTIMQFDNASENSDKSWHFHPELELVYVHKGKGKRHVGNHISYYDDGDLILLGSNLPHYGFTNRYSGHSKEIVVQWKADFLGTMLMDLPETAHIRNLYDLSLHGIVFYGNIKRRIGERMSEMVHDNTFDRLINLVKILDQLAKTDEYRLLNASTVGLVINQKDTDRIDLVYDYVRENFDQEDISLTAVSDLVSMTVPSFCRYFKKHTNKTFTQFVNEFRIVHATKLLAETTDQISDICFQCGFNNFSYFNRTFKKLMGESPNNYRKSLNQGTSVANSRKRKHDSTHFLGAVS